MCRYIYAFCCSSLVQFLHLANELLIDFMCSGATSILNSCRNPSSFLLKSDTECAVVLLLSQKVMETIQLRVKSDIEYTAMLPQSQTVVEAHTVLAYLNWIQTSDFTKKTRRCPKILPQKPESLQRTKIGNF